MKGVTYDKARDRWKARMTLDGHRIDLGRFKTEEEATKALLDFQEEQRTPFSDGFDFEETPLLRDWRSYGENLFTRLTSKFKRS